VNGGVGHETMEDVIRGVALLIVGAAFIAIGINVLRTYKRSVLATPRQVMLWDVLSVLFTGPWSFPVGLAAIIMALGAFSAFFGSAVLVAKVF
jgi:hypothetical protein